MNIVEKLGYVVGIFITRIPDSDDADRFPDDIGADIKPIITPVTKSETALLIAPSHGASGVFLTSREYPCGIMSNGHLTGDVDKNGVVKSGAVPGIWLPVGSYKITLGGHTDDLEFDVLETHTQETPLDLYQHALSLMPPV